MSSAAKSTLLLLHYWFPICLGISIALVLHRDTGQPLSPAGLALFVAGICAAYSLDRLLDAPDEKTSRWLQRALWLGFALSASIGLIASAWLSFKTLSTMIIFAVASLIYRQVKRFPAVKTVLVAIVWTWAGAALAINNENWGAWKWWTIDASLPLVLLIAAGCILCDLKDTESDRRQGVQSLPVLLGVPRTIVIVMAMAIIAAVLALLDGRPGIFYSGLLLAVSAFFPALLSQQAVGPLIVDAILSLPGILILTHLV